MHVADESQLSFIDYKIPDFVFYKINRGYASLRPVISELNEIRILQIRYLQVAFVLLCVVKIKLFNRKQRGQLFLIVPNAVVDRIPDGILIAEAAQLRK